ncbi:uncharacterized protein ACB057_002842 [Neosynchiropus ocellatus]
MDSSSVFFSLQHSWCSDSDLSSISSPETLSPVHSMDSSLSPSYQQLPQSTPKTPQTRSCPYSGSGRGKPGRAPRIRSKQRESASEKEKLRMRDLTKALHHLRSYLPPSMAPTGQTLTKIETLRLTIRYISYLSAQLGLSEEVLFQRRERGDTSASGASSPDIMGYFRQSSAGHLVQLQTQNQLSYQNQCQAQQAALHSGSCGIGARPHGGSCADTPQRDANLVLQSCPGAQGPSYQMCNEDFCLGLVPLEFWS